jgi:hypothetical protein
MLLCVHEHQTNLPLPKVRNGVKAELAQTLVRQSPQCKESIAKTAPLIDFLVLCEVPLDPRNPIETLLIYLKSTMYLIKGVIFR